MKGKPSEHEKCSKAYNLSWISQPSWDSETRHWFAAGGEASDMPHSWVVGLHSAWSIWRLQDNVSAKPRKCSEQLKIMQMSHQTFPNWNSWEITLIGKKLKSSLLSDGSHQAKTGPLLWCPCQTWEKGHYRDFIIGCQLCHTVANHPK